jgi:hypothetical protein
MDKRKWPVTTHLYKYQIDDLSRIAEEREVTKAVLFRRAIDNLIAECDNNPSGNIGMAVKGKSK